MAALGQEGKARFGFTDMAGSYYNSDDIEVDIASDEGSGDDDGMTREIMGEEYTENLTLSRVDFDQWMANHASLEEGVEAAGEPAAGLTSCDDEGGNGHGAPSTEDVRSQWLTDCTAWGVHSSRDQFERSGSVRGVGIEDDPISIGSSDVEDDCGDRDDYDSYDDSCEYERRGFNTDGESGTETSAPSGVHQGLNAHGHGEPQYHYSEGLLQASISPVDLVSAAMQSTGYDAAAAAQYSSDMECDYPQPSKPAVCEIDPSAVANAMLYLNGSFDHITGGSEALATVAEPISPPLSAYQRPPLPPAHLPLSLADMHKTIGHSIERSISMVDEILTSCDEAASVLIPSLTEDECAETGAGIFARADSANGWDRDPTVATEQDVAISSEVELRDDAHPAGESGHMPKQQQDEYASKINALNTQIFKLSAELQQVSSDKARLDSAVKQLEQENGDFMQSVDDLQQQLKDTQAADCSEIEGLKERVRHVASKLALLTDEHICTKERLDETKQVLTIVSSERTDLIGKCRGLESSLESLASRLASEQHQHEQTKRALHIARDGNANEARRTELESANEELEKRCRALAGQLAQSNNHERLLLNANRALEARLGGVLRRLDEPMRPEDTLADHQRCWDAQLVECRKETATARKQLEHAEASLASERHCAEMLRKRVQELEMVGQPRNDQSVKKRRLESEPFDVAANTAEPEQPLADGVDNDYVVVTPIRNPGPARSYSYDSTTPSRLPVYTGRTGALQQTLVDAGEHARDRRRKNEPNRRLSTAAERGPVTPRVGLCNSSLPRRTPQALQESLAASLQPTKRAQGMQTPRFDLQKQLHQQQQYAGKMSAKPKQPSTPFPAAVDDRRSAENRVL
ncbi:hypothetical protein EV174_000722 [Coemansia sp. RSA 2320]|nr:hypothetical protein EV174_000722 [Coemansia sp. RSA 2320]